MSREPVRPTLRRPVGTARKRRCHTRENGKCWMCGKPVEMTGPTVRYDHKLPLELGGADDDANLYPLHAEPCDRIKTAADRVRIDKARRIRKREDGTRRERRNIPQHVNGLQGRGFDKTLTKGFDGVVRERPRPFPAKHKDAQR
jgi:hypothetical protein